MPCPKSSPNAKNSLGDGDDENRRSTPYEKLMDSLHHDPKWLEEVNLGRRIGLYKLKFKLGSGNFSHVKLAFHQLTKEMVAIKIIDKGKLNDKMMRKINQEISTMEAIHHPNLIRPYEVMETYSKLYLVMEYASGGELFNKVNTHGKLDELVARHLFAQICSAVSHMHEKHIIHRDIKAENVFFSGPNRVKLGDFGLSAQLAECNQRLNTCCGSPAYAAPELLCDESYLGQPVDIWALGILLYFMVVGRLPFKGQNVSTLKTNILAGVYKVPKHVSKECADLLEGIIQLKPAQRLKMSSILSSSWLKGISLPSPPDTNQDYCLTPTVSKFSEDSNIQYSDVERTARERLADLGITSELLESHCYQGSKSHIIGTYRIVIHRVQKQLCSFFEVDGFLVPQKSSPTKKQDKECIKKENTKLQVINILGKDSSKDDLFSNCWRRKASSDTETDAKDSCNTKDKVNERLAVDEMKPLESTKFALFHNRVPFSAKDGEESKTSSVVRSRTCSIL